MGAGIIRDSEQHAVNITYETRSVSWQTSMQFWSWKKSFLRRDVAPDAAADCLAVDDRLASSSCSSVCHASNNPEPRNSSSITTPHTDTHTLLYYRYNNNNNDTRLTALFHNNPRKPVLERLHSGFYWSKNDGSHGDNWNYFQNVQSSSQIVTTNKPTASFLQAGLPAFLHCYGTSIQSFCVNDVLDVINLTYTKNY